MGLIQVGKQIANVLKSGLNKENGKVEKQPKSEEQTSKVPAKTSEDTQVEVAIEDDLCEKLPPLPQYAAKLGEKVRASYIAGGFGEALATLRKGISPSGISEAFVPQKENLAFTSQKWAEFAEEFANSQNKNLASVAQNAAEFGEAFVNSQKENLASAAQKSAELGEAFANSQKENLTSGVEKGVELGEKLKSFLDSDNAD